MAARKTGSRSFPSSTKGTSAMSCMVAATLSAPVPQKMLPGGNHPPSTFPPPAPGTNPPAIGAGARRNGGGRGPRMREDVLGAPAGEVEPHPFGQEPEAGLCQFGAALARQHDVELLAQGMQMQHVG